MNQPALFITDIYDALGDVVRALGGPKKVGAELRPEKPADEAATWVKDCLNRNRREKFDPDQVLWLLRKGREIECHAAMNYLAQQAGYAEPQPIEPETELAKLLREYLELEAKRSGMQPQIDELRAKLRVA
jgi:hypothetical protein